MLRRRWIFTFCLSEDWLDVSIRSRGPATGQSDTGFVGVSFCKHATRQLLQQ